VRAVSHLLPLRRSVSGRAVRLGRSGEQAAGLVAHADRR